jgi:hypothetical protein
MRSHHGGSGTGAISAAGTGPSSWVFAATHTAGTAELSAKDSPRLAPRKKELLMKKRQVASTGHTIHTHLGRVPPISTKEMEQAFACALLSLPHKVQYGGGGAVVIHLTSGRTATIRPAITKLKDAIKVELIVEELEEADLPELMGIHHVLMLMSAYTAQIRWLKDRAAA